MWVDSTPDSVPIKPFFYRMFRKTRGRKSLTEHVRLPKLQRAPVAGVHGKRRPLCAAAEAQCAFTKQK